MLGSLRRGKRSKIRFLYDIRFFDADCCTERHVGPEAALDTAGHPDISAVIGDRCIIADHCAGHQVLVVGKPVGPAEIGTDVFLLLSDVQSQPQILGTAEAVTVLPEYPVAGSVAGC